MIILKRHVFEDKSIAELRLNKGKYYKLGDVRHIDVLYAEYQEGSYIEGGEEDHHFMVSMTSHFAVRDFDEAVSAYKLMVEYFSSTQDLITEERNGIMSAYKRLGYSLEEIVEKNKQPLKAEPLSEAVQKQIAFHYLDHNFAN